MVYYYADDGLEGGEDAFTIPAVPYKKLKENLTQNIIIGLTAAAAFGGGRRGENIPALVR